MVKSEMTIIGGQVHKKDVGLWALVIICFFLSVPSRAEMISTQKIAFADIEEIYSRFRMKELAEKEIELRKEKYLSEIRQVDEKIRQLEASIALEEERIVVSVSTVSAETSQIVNSTTSQASTEISTATVKTVTPAEQMEELKNQKNLLSAEAKEGLKNIKSEYMSQIMGRIYDACAEAAKEGGYALIIDKSNAVYGIPATDLTERILEKLK
ncbi:OmpH family outer membrane protein [bacterium]|nr:OmpH family outer membrane protein [bacterium]MBU4134146.1 OmpH family outer membrane protein [bacterium]